MSKPNLSGVFDTIDTAAEISRAIIVMASEEITDERVIWALNGAVDELNKINDAVDLFIKPCAVARGRYSVNWTIVPPKKLKECPFCGGEAQLFLISRSTFGSLNGARVMCKKCSANSGIEYEGMAACRGKKHCDFIPLDDALKSAMDSWNARVVEQGNSNVRADT